MNSHTARAWLELALVPGVSLTAKLAWLRAFGSPEAVLHQSVAALKEHSQEARPLANIVESSDIDRVLDWSAHTGGRCLYLSDEDYPVRLLERLTDAPLVVFVQGDLTLLEQPLVALIGSAHPTSTGSSRAQTLALELAQERVAVVAGISPGIASAAHAGVQAAAKGSIGIVGNAQAWEGVRLTEQIASQGLLLSEFTPRFTQQQRFGYSRRYRLLSGLVDLLVVIEASAEGDALRLATDASDMGCEVAAIPADPSHLLSRGCNLLLRDGAALVEDSKDILALVSAWS